jgi:hypothetical protein
LGRSRRRRSRQTHGFAQSGRRWDRRLFPARPAEVKDVKLADERFPLMRACLLWDPLRVAEDGGEPVDDLLEKFLLTRRMLKHPCCPIPMGSGVSLLASLAERAGPVFLLRVVSDDGWLNRLKSNVMLGNKNHAQALLNIPEVTKKTSPTRF